MLRQLFWGEGSALNNEVDKKYVPALDGVRGISILFVLESHYGYPILPGGFGVTVFFFISGFLITRLLLEESGRLGRLSLSNFYLRRILRLAPALVVFVLVSSVVWYVLFKHYDLNAVFAALFYWFNYFRLAYGPEHYPPFNVLWSLAVEEHFYIFYPLVLSLMLGKLNRLTLILVGMVILALGWRFSLQLMISTETLALPQEYLKKATDCRFDSILFGAILALTVSLDKFSALMNFLRNYTFFVLGGVLILISITSGVNPIISEELRPYLLYVFRYTLVGVGLILAFNFVLFDEAASVFRSLLSGSLLVYIGRLSYSVYLWHLAILVTIREYIGSTVPWDLRLACLAITFVVAAISYHWIERHFIKMRVRFGSNIVR